jgi:hypothetical protein
MNTKTDPFKDPKVKEKIKYLYSKYTYYYKLNKLYEAKEYSDKANKLYEVNFEQRFHEKLAKKESKDILGVGRLKKLKYG